MSSKSKAVDATETTEATTDARQTSIITENSSVFQKLFGETLRKTPSLAQGLKNLAMLPPVDPENPTPIPGTEYYPGVIAFNRYSRNVSVACGKASVRYFHISKLVGMVESLHEDIGATTVIQNFHERDGNQPERGQILGRINYVYSAITIMQGFPGRAIKGFSDTTIQEHYYVDRTSLAAVYMAAKFQLLNEPILESIQNAFDGWRAFEIPLNPLRPHDFAPFSIGRS